MKQLVFFLFISIITYSVKAQSPIILDTSFNHTGEVFASFGTSISANSSLLQTDGKIIVAGNGSLSGNGRIVLMRFLSNGSVDSSYGTNGVVADTFVNTTNNQLHAIALQTDGKLLISAAADSLSINRIGLARYKNNGTPDSSFGTNGQVAMVVVNSSMNALTVQPDGKIIGVGSIGGLFAIFRFNADGSKDNSFGNGGNSVTAIGTLPYDDAKSVLIQPDGKIVIGGSSYHSLYYLATMVRYNTDGSVDTSFGTNGVVITSVQAYHDEINNLKLQPDGKIVASGTTTYHAFSITQNSFMALRYQPNGSPDSTFGTLGIVIASLGTSDDKCYSGILQSDGKLILGGYTTNASINLNYAMLRLNADGTSDNSFGSNGVIDHNFVLNTSNCNDNGRIVLMQPDGKLVLFGYSTCANISRLALVRYTSSYVLGLHELKDNDASFFVYPNPSCNQVSLHISSKIKSAESVYFLNAIGELVYTKVISKPDETISISQLASGLYIVKFRNQYQKLMIK